MWWCDNMGNLVLWSKLGSEGEISSPQVGAYRSAVNSRIYAPVKFDNGFRINHVSNVGNLIFDPLTMPNGKGCAEVWAVLAIAIVNGGFDSDTYTSRTFFTVGTNVSDTIRCNIGGSGIGGGTRILVSGGGTLSVTNYNIPINTPFHVAVVWDKDGIAGGSDTVRLYIDGIQKGALQNSAGLNVTPNRIAAGSRITSGSTCWGLAQGYNGGIDNIKVWDYAKTDFSDRFFESGSQIAKRSFSNKFNGGFNF